MKTAIDELHAFIDDWAIESHRRITRVADAQEGAYVLSAGAMAILLKMMPDAYPSFTRKQRIEAITEAMSDIDLEPHQPKAEA